MSAVVWCVAYPLLVTYEGGGGLSFSRSKGRVAYRVVAGDIMIPVVSVEKTNVISLLKKKRDK